MKSEVESKRLMFVSVNFFYFRWAVYLMGKDALDRDGQVDKSKAAQYLTSTGIIFEQENQGGVYVFSFNGDKSKVSFL